MKKLIVLLIVLFVAYIVMHRQRIFLHDVIGSVARNGVKEAGAQVFINYNNDVLLENDNAPAYTLIVQHGGNFGTPAVLKCIHWVACQTDANAASLVSEEPRAQIKAMTGKMVDFTDSEGRDVIVTLR